MKYIIFDVNGNAALTVTCFQVTTEQREEYAEETGRRFLGDQFLCIEPEGI